MGLSSPLRPSLPHALRRAKAKKLMQAIALTMPFILGLSPTSLLAEGRAVITKVSPAYPELAKRMRIGGVVKIHVTVDTDGKVKSVNPYAGPTVLTEAAKQAVSQWKFAPGDHETEENIEINFTL